MIPSGTRVFLAAEPADLRRSFDGLAATAIERLQRDPREGGLFVFLNRRANQVRVLFRDPHGVRSCQRLDGGRFRRPRIEDGCFVWETEAQVLLRFLDDIVPPAPRGSPRSKSSRRSRSCNPSCVVCRGIADGVVLGYRWIEHQTDDHDEAGRLYRPSRDAYLGRQRGPLQEGDEEAESKKQRQKKSKKPRRNLYRPRGQRRFLSLKKNARVPSAANLGAR